MPHPYTGVAIVAGYNTVQARSLPGADSIGVAIEAAEGVLLAAGMPVREVDAVFGQNALEVVHALGIAPRRSSVGFGRITTVMDAAAAIAAGVYRAVIVVGGDAGVHLNRASTAPWTRPANEFVLPFGMYTAVEFALVARAHMDRYGTTPEQMATVAAQIRNQGSICPGATYFGRGPFTPDDILASRMVADPFHVLDCAMTSEGGAAVLLTTVERAADLAPRPVFILGAESDHLAPSYQLPPTWEYHSRHGDTANGVVGRRAARNAFSTAGLQPTDVDCCELYDPFSFEIIRQFEAFEFCGEGEGGPFAVERMVGTSPRLPTTTDGGTMSYSHSGSVQMLQRVIRGVHQIQGTCASSQVEADVVLCSNGGAGAFFTDVMLLGRHRP